MSFWKITVQTRTGAFGTFLAKHDCGGWTWNGLAGFLVEHIRGIADLAWWGWGADLTVGGAGLAYGLKGCEANRTADNAAVGRDEKNSVISVAFETGKTLIGIIFNTCFALGGTTRLKLQLILVDLHGVAAILSYYLEIRGVLLHRVDQSS